jgi:hypothetical protein
VLDMTGQGTGRRDLRSLPRKAGLGRFSTRPPQVGMKLQCRQMADGAKPNALQASKPQIA